VGLALFAPVLERVEQLRIEARQASEVLDIYLVGLSSVGVDEPQFAGVGHKDLVAALLQEAANPGREGARFYSDAHRRPLGSGAPFEGLGAGTQPTLLDDLAAVLVDEAQVGVPVAEVQSGHHQWSPFVTIHVGRSSFPKWAFKSPSNACRSKGTAYGGSAFSSHLFRTP